MVLYTHVLKIATGTTTSPLDKLMPPTMNQYCLNVRY